MIANRLFCLGFVALFALSPLALAATPTIGSVTGTVSSGQVLTISGANLQNETKTGWDVYFATTYPNAWSFEGASKTADGYDDLGVSDGVYVTDIKLIGNKSYKFNVGGASTTCPDDNLTSYAAMNPAGGDANNYWVRAYVRWSLTGGTWPSSHIKMMDIQGGGPQYYFQPQATGSSLPSNMNAIYDGTSHYVAIPSGQLENNRWYLMELNWDTSAQPYRYAAWIDGVQVIDATPSARGSWDFLLFGMINVCGTPSNFSLDHWFDGLAIGTQRIYGSSVVEIGNGSNYATATKAYQPPEFISDGQVQIKANLTGLGTGPYYLWVTNNNQERSSAYNLSGSTHTVTPSAGAGGTISPNTAQTINSGSTTTFTVTPNSGYTASVGGTCGGSLAGTTYTTNAITADCTVSATFADTEVPTTPTNLDAYSPSTSQIVFRWQPSTDNAAVTEYRVQTCAGYGCTNFSQIGTSATTSYTLSGITPSANPTIYRYRVIAADAAGNVSGNPTSVYFNATPTIPAFPGAEGGGATSKGGRGGTVYRVTSLLGDTSAGTLRACIAASGPRTCVFDVAGNIELTGNINISSPYITIAGQTAPGGGITISGKNSTQVSLTVRTHNVTIRGIRIRKGYNAGTPAQDGDSVNVLSAAATPGPVGPVIFDHVSISWGQDENGGSWGSAARPPKNITYQWTMIYEPLLAHPVNFMTGAATNATAERMTDIDLHHSLIANSSHRNPLIKNKTTRIVNNLIYNWGDWAAAGEGTVQIDFIGNKFKTGPLYHTISSKSYEIELNPAGDTDTPNVGSPSLYVVGNIGQNNANPLADNWGMTRLIDIPTNAGVELGPLSESYRRLTPLAALPFPITTHDVAAAESSVLTGAGASRRLDCAGSWVSMRDSADTRVVAEYTAGNAGIIPTNEDAVGGYPTLSAGTACTDTDGDGMPDTWETANGLNINSAADGPTLHASGYSNLEMYLAGPSTETTPVLSNLLPTSNLARTATSATLQATTDQTATCRYALGSGTPYAGMTPFTNTANTAHSSSVSVVAGGVYQYCVRCMGTSLVSDESCTRFAVDPNPKKRVLH